MKLFMFIFMWALFGAVPAIYGFVISVVLQWLFGLALHIYTLRVIKNGMAHR